MIKAARVRVAVWKQQPPPVLRRLVHELVDLFPRGDVERQMVQAGPAPVVTAGDPVGRLLKDDVSGTHLPALPLRPLHEGLVTQLAKQPSPAGLGPGQVRNPELDVVNHPRASMLHPARMPGCGPDRPHHGASGAISLRPVTIIGAGAIK